MTIQDCLRSTSNEKSAAYLPRSALHVNGRERRLSATRSKGSFWPLSAASAIYAQDYWDEVPLTFTLIHGPVV